MNSFDEALKKKSALRSATGNPLGPQQPAARLPQYTTPAVLDAQRRADAAGRAAAAARPAPTPLRAGIPGPNTMIADGAGNIARTPGDMAGFQANSQPRVDSVAANRAEIDRIKAENAARGQGPLRAGAGAPPPPVQPPPAAAASAPPPDPVKPVRGVAGEAPAKPAGIFDRARSALRMAPKGAPAASAAPAAPTKWYAPKGAGAKLLGMGARYVTPIAVTGSAINSLQTPTSDYAKRFGTDNPQTFMGDIGLRTAGVATDAISALADPFLDLAGAPTIGGLFPDRQAKAAAAAAPAAAAAQPGAAAEQPRDPYVSPYPNGVPDPGGVPDPAQRAALEVLARQAPGVGGIDLRAGEGYGGGGLRGQSLASSLDANGNPVYDNASIARMQARSALSGTGGGGVASQSFGGPTTVAESPLRRPNLRMGSDFPQTPSRASAINAQFDAVAKQIKDLHSSSKFGAKGSLATKLLRLEEARAQALGNDQDALVSSQGNQVNDLNNKRTNEVSIFNTETGERSALRRENGESARARVVAATEALKLRQQAYDSNLERFKDVASGLFQTKDKDGNATTDTARTARFLAEVTQNMPGLLTMDGPEATQGLAYAMRAFEQNEQMNKDNPDAATSRWASLDKIIPDATMLDAFTKKGVTAGDVVRDATEGLPFVEDYVGAEDANGRRYRLRKGDLDNLRDNFGE